MGQVLAEHQDEDGRALTLRTAAGELHLHLPLAPEHRLPALVVPIDTAFELRIEVARHLARQLRGRGGALVPKSLRLTSYQKQRLIQLLHAFDICEAGGGPREIAAEILNSGQATLPSVEWKDSHARRRANRLIHDAMRMVENDYLKLLHGA